MKDRKRLAQVLGMLGSSHDGERAAAARHADRLARELGLTWEELIDNDAGSYQAGYDQGFQDAAERAMALHDEQQEEVARLRQQMVNGGAWGSVDANTSTRTAAVECLASDMSWNAWERQFLEDMQFRHVVSPKQGEIVNKLYAKMQYYKAKK